MSLVKNLYFQTLIVIVLTLISFGVEAKAQTPQIAFPTSTFAAPGSTAVEVPITLSNNTGSITGYVIEVSYNPNVIRPNEFPFDTSGTLSTINQFNQGCLVEFGITMNSATVNTLRLAAACRPEITAASGTLIKLRFDVFGAGGTTSPLQFNVTADPQTSPTFFEYNSGVPNQPTRVAPATVNGTFTVTGPTAASVNLSGRVLSVEGRGLRGAQIRLTAADGSTKTVMTSAFGYYRFADVQAGQSVTIQVMSKKYGFQPQVVNVSGDVSDLNFVAQP
jgi:hypothetical protein